MNIDQIITHFINKGCLTSSGETLDLENCQKLHEEYLGEIRKLGCKCRKGSVDTKWRMKIKDIFKNKPEQSESLAEAPDPFAPQEISAQTTPSPTHVPRGVDAFGNPTGRASAPKYPDS